MFLVKYRNTQWNYLVPCPEWWMLHKPGCSVYRHQRVQQERRRWFQDLDVDVKLRKRRSPKYLDSWGLLEAFPSVIDTKSWKHLYKVRKQWQKPKYHDEKYQ